MDSAQFFRDIADNLVFEQGKFDPLRFLIDAGFLDEEAHAEWLAGEHDNLESILACDVEEAIDALELARKYLLKQGLSDTAQATSGSDARDAVQRIGSTSKFIRACTSVLIPAQPQADLFRDTASLLAEQTAKAELAAHRLGAAADALQRLSSLGGASGVERGLRELHNVATSKPPANIADHLNRLEHDISPLATRLLGSHARGYLAPLWQAAAKRLAATPFDIDAPNLHASHAYARANDWRAVVKSVESQHDWRLHEALALRAAEAHARLSNREASRRAWTRLCWHHPVTAARTLATAPGDPQVARHWREFMDCDPELPPQDFPAWLLIVDVRQRQYVPADTTSTDPIEAAYAAMHRLTERPDDIDARRVVNAYNRNLLGQFLSRRSVK
jgi:hypothetical protein